MVRLSSVLALALVTAAGSAHAGTFDPEGDFSHDPAAVFTFGFDTVAPSSSVKVVHGGDAIDGAAYVNIDTSSTNNAATFPVTLPHTDASYVARMWARTNRLVASVSVSYPNDGGSPSFGARFYPSGTVTSDGWYEVVTNEFSVQGSRKPTVSLSVVASAADVDALEIVPQGTFKALAACSPPVDSACGAHEVCAAGWCRNGNVFVPPLPPPQEIDSVIAYFRARLSTFFGGRYSRLNYLPNALATLDGLHHAPDPWTFWDGMATALHRLHDWHTTINGPVSFSGRGLLPVCFVEGDADMTHSIAPKDPSYYDVLVSHVGPAGTTLVPGDRLVAVNGMHPFAFANSLEAIDWGMWRADDPDAHEEAAERMVSLIRRYATNITVIHCDPVAMTCGAPQTIAVSSLPFDDGSYQYPYCDSRPAYHIPGPDPVQHDSYNGPFYGVVNESLAGEDIYGMVWNDVYLDPSSTSNPYQPAYDTFQSSAKAVILDHRLGDGGDVQGATYLTSLWRPSATAGAMVDFDLTVGEFDNWTTSAGINLYDTNVGPNPYPVGSSSPLSTVPVALLLARDGSASDWFPHGMTAGGANIRLFGRHTAGAFSTYIDFDYYANFSWRLAGGDLINADGTTNLGMGVPTDEELVPLQSDLLAGRDTVYLAALDWVRTCTSCR